MAEDRYLLYKNFNFKVEVNGVLLSFSKVSGLERNASMEAVREGGFNFHTHYLHNAPDGDRTLTLEYGMADFNQSVSQLSPGRFLPKGVTVMVLGDDRSKIRVTYALDGCYIRRINFGDLDAEHGGLIVNQLEIAYSSITEMK
ncbi:MAG: phage tail protein [Lachnospiraceae bacterium]|nr:phage tail protein [Lachnospiraceae bacterium]